LLVDAMLVDRELASQIDLQTDQKDLT